MSGEPERWVVGWAKLWNYTIPVEVRQRLETALQFSQTTVLPIRGQNWFGSAGFVASSARPGSYRRGDLILPHYRATGSHVVVDVAVGDPCGSVALAAGSDVRGGVAAASKQSSKHRKYDSLCDQIGSEFRAGVVERFGACCDDVQGLIRMVAGDGECDAGSVEWSPTATSRITRAAQCVVFSTVMAEARMVRDVMDLDVYGRERAALPGAGPRGTRGGG